MTLTPSTLIAVRATLLLALLAGPALAESETEASSRVPVTLVLDGSGSMWGRVDGEVKMDIARTVVRQLATQFGDQIDLGVVAYGHRRKGDCTDIETLVVPGAGDTQSLLAAVDSVKPKGKTPLAAALEQAARDLSYRNRQAVVTVVSDGRETCGLDPCAVAARLASTGADFTAHVIGFDMTEKEGRELRCIASATGGLFARASSRAELIDALGEVLTRTVEPTGPATLVLSASYGEYEQPIFDDLHWTVTPLDAPDDAAAGPIKIDRPAEELTLEAGRYDVRVEFRGATIERHLELRAGETWNEHVRFGQGQLALRAVLSEGGDPIAEPITWAVRPIGRFGKVAEEPVFESERATCLVRLDAGHYEVSARYGDTERRLRLELRAGTIQPHTVDLEAGEARIFAALPPPGGPFLDRVEWTIRPFDERGGKDAPLVERAATSETFVLPVGRYHVTGRHADLIGDAIVSVEAGRSQAVSIVLHGRPASPGRR